LKETQILPSILSADFSRLGEQIREVERAGADGIHLDIMDGHFVPNLTIGPVVVETIRKATWLPFWAHLMIENPEKFIRPFHEAGTDGMLIHTENGKDISGLIDMIHGFGKKAGIALNPETGVDALAPYLNRIERVLIMSVHPGFGGQEFLDGMLDKIREVRRIADTAPNPPIIDIDGGIHLFNLSDVVRAGVDSVVAGSAIFDTPDPAETIAEFRRLARSAKDSS
jgi:ribulose-phosphate 3-epimerase